MSCPLRCLPRDEPSARPSASPSPAQLADPQSPRNYCRARQVRGNVQRGSSLGSGIPRVSVPNAQTLAGTAHLVACSQHSTPLIDAASMPIVTKVAPSPSCDGRYAPGAQLRAPTEHVHFARLHPQAHRVLTRRASTIGEWRSMLTPHSARPPPSPAQLQR